MRLLLCLLLGSASAAAGPEGFSSLRILPGVREAAMGGVGVASAAGPQAIAWNPSATATVRGISLTAAYTRWFLDMHQQSLFFARGFSNLTVSGGVSSFSAGKFEYREEVPTEEPLGTFEPVELSAYLNFARSVGPLAELGATARYFYSKVMSYEAAGLGLDLGFRVRPVSGLTVGASVVDFGQTMAFRRDPAWLPTRGRAGASFEHDFGGWGVVVASDASYFFYTKGFNVQAGVEARIARLLQLRAGYDFLSTANHLNLGLGLTPGRFQINYAYTPMERDLGAAHRFSVGFTL